MKMTTSRLVIDGLNCAPLTPEQIRRTIDGGISTINLTAIRPQSGIYEGLLEVQAALDKIAAMPELALVVRTTADIFEAKASGRCGVIIGAQNSVMVEPEVRLLEVFKTLGLRIVQPTYNERNAFGYGAPFLGDGDRGITEAGRAWVAEMNKNGMIIDLSHCGLKTSADFIAESKQPVVFSHANAMAICPSPRNKTDELLRAISKTGGLTGMVTWPPVTWLPEKPTLEHILNHIDYLVNVCGIDHVAWASDMPEVETREHWEEYWGTEGLYPNITGILGDWYTYDNRLNADVGTITKVPLIWDGMVKRGYSEDQIEKISSGNWLRVMKDVWGA